MARIVGISPAKMSGSVGGFTYRQTKNGTIVSEKIQKKANPKRTLRMMKYRTVLANLATFFKAFNGSLERGFEKMPSNWSTINAFISANSQRARVYLTKTMVQNGASVVDGYQITRGSIRPIDLVATGNAFRTDLSLGSLVINAATTVADFAKALVANNEEVRFGDQISYFAIRQLTDANGYPRVDVKKYEVTLDPLSEEKVWDIVSNDGFQTNNGYLGQLASGTALVGGFAWVISREVNGSLLVSTQFIHSTNTLMVAELSSAEAMERAINSYGGLSNEVFLQPGETEGGYNPGNSDTPVTPTPSGVNISVVSANPTMGSVNGSGTYVEGATVTITATANSGYKFTQWQDGNTQNPRQITASESKTYTASFATDSTSGGGGGMMGD